ncbi:MAG: STAS domain-containing protein [Deferribacteres bacterium]|nr:STAS domain-containing protein [candidate division KSB1 bacterium]MCB9501562.1 STAS domain-containing protein [Deferribacteres bacterium]
MKRQKLLSLEESPKVVIATLHAKRLYLQYTDQFKAEMEEQLRYIQANFIIDFSGVNIINSLAIGVLIASANTVRNKHKKFIIVGLNPYLREIFKRMRLDLILEIKKDLQEGMTLLK